MSDNIPAFEQYPFRVEPLPADEGGGFVIRFPDLPGCLSDGDSVDEAIANGREAFAAWMEAQLEDGQPAPRPNDGGEPAKFVQRLPKYLHVRLMERAAQEGVSMNALVTAFVAEGLAGRDAYRHAVAPVAGVQDAGHANDCRAERTEFVARTVFVARELEAENTRPGSYSEVGSGSNVVMFRQQAKSQQAGGR